MTKTIPFFIFIFFSIPIKAQICLENYNSSQNWTHNGANNTIFIENGKLNFVQSRNNPCEYVYRPIGFALSDAKWTMEFEFSPVKGTETGIANLLASVTSTTADPIATTWEPLALTENNAISVFYTCEFGAAANAYNIGMLCKQGSTMYALSERRIICPTGRTYYIRVERVNPNSGIMSIFTDAARTQHQSGSPLCFAINAAITNLQHLQHGADVAAHPDRALTATLDNMRLENNKNTSTLRDFKPTINGNPFVCSGGTATLTAYNAAYTSYLWSDGSTGSILNPTKAGVYSVTVTSATGECGGGSNSIAVTEVKAPVLRILGDKMACKGSLAQIIVQDSTEIAPNTTRYAWNDGSAKDTLRASEGTYSVTATNPYGCIAVANVTVLAGAPLLIPVLAVEGKCLSIYNPQPNYAYEWLQNGKIIAQANPQKYTVKKADLYQVCAKNPDGCRACNAAVWVGKIMK